MYYDLLIYAINSMINNSMILIKKKTGRQDSKIKIKVLNFNNYLNTEYCEVFALTLIKN